MKIKEGFVIRKAAGKYVAVATGKASREFHGMVKLNETGKTIWEGIAACPDIFDYCPQVVYDNKLQKLKDSILYTYEMETEKDRG